MPLLIAVALVLSACLGAVPTSAPTDTVPATPVPDPKHETYGFVQYWEMDGSIPDHLATVDLTTLALFSVTHTRSGELDGGKTGGAASWANPARA
jgi:hypothetical protein